MADPGMMSIFGDDGNLFSDELEGLGDCGYPQGQANPMSQQMPHEHQGYGQLSSSLHLSSPAVPGQAKLGHHFDHFSQYEQPKMHPMDQQGGRVMGNGPVNGMSSPHSRYGAPPGAGGAGGHHVYQGAQGDGRSQSFPDSGNAWGPQAMQVPEQARPPFQQQPPQPSSHQHGPAAHQMGPYIGHGDYAMQGHNQTQTPPRMNHFPQGLPQEANHFMGHVGMTQNPSLSGPPMRHPTQPPQQHQQPNQQFLHRPGQGPVHSESVASHNSQFPRSPSRQQQQQQVMSGRPHQNLGFNMHNQPVPSNTVNSSGQYPPYPPFGNLNQGLANTSGMGPNLSLTTSSNSNPNTPVTQVQRYPAPTGPLCYQAPGAQQGPMHQQPIHVNQINTQPMHTAQQKLQQQHLPPQGSYSSPPSMSPMRNLATPAGTPPPQQGRPPSTGLGTDVGSYPGVPHQSQGPMVHPQRGSGTMNTAQQHPHQQQLQSHPSHPHPPPTQIYAALSPNHRATGVQGRPPVGPGSSHGEGPQDQRLLSQQAPRKQLQTPPLPYQQQQLQQVHTPPTIPPSQTHLTALHQSSPPSQQAWAPPHQSLPSMQKVPHMQHSPSDPSLEMMSSINTPASGPNLQPANCDIQQTESEIKPKKKKKKKVKVSEGQEANDISSEAGGTAALVNERDSLVTPMDQSAVEKKSKKKPKDKEPKEPKEPKIPKTPKAPKTPKEPKEPKEKKVKATTLKSKTSKKSSAKKSDSESGNSIKKEAKRKREPSVNSDVEKTPPHSPEEEEDDSVQKRRSSRQVKRKRYTEDLEFRISDEDGDDSPGPKSPTTSEQQELPDAEGPVVEKIMGMRMGKKELESGEEVEVEEFYVKFKGFSYLHCRWADIEELEKDKRIQQKVKRFKAKHALSNFLSEMDDEPFNPDYVEVDRVLDVSESTDENGEPVSLYLVKWCSLPYEDSTWELKADIDEGKIEEFKRVMLRDPELKRVERPPATDWQKSESSREYKNSNSLREYQLEGVNWMLFNWYNIRNCILADEMGLGKTIQSITLLYEIYLKGIQGPFLVIAPLSTIPNWEREFRTWTELNIVVYHGSQASRKTIQAYEMYYRDSQNRVIKGAYKFHAIITTFEMILTDCPELRTVPWRCVIIDEAHRLKNRNCKLLEGLKMMDMEHKVLLTGTPLQNTVEELFSLLNFLEPDRFPSEVTFMLEFGDLKTEEQVQKLQGILKPMMLRRLKEDVEKNLAPKEETIIEVELTNVQKKYYRAILEKNFAFLSKSGGSGGGANAPNLLNTMMELRKCCNHPYLINGAEEKIMDEFRESHPTDHPEFHLQSMIQAAGKLVLIDKLLPKLKAGGHRVLIFSQMVRCLDILEDYLIQRRYPYERIDGRVRGNLRQAAIDRFSRPDSDRFVFLLCTRAGGLGINLTAADTCIIFDSDWNPQNDLQAQARCHRIGQSKAVKIYRLITRNSYEREMFDKASLKLGLDKAVLQSMSGRENAANGVQQLSKKEIEDLLRKGAYGALMDEEDEGSKFCEEDIDQILQRRTQTITIESEGKGSTFAKASFVSSGNRTDISLEDPDFWQKWAKKAELDMDVISSRNNLVIDTPRVRKQTRHYSSMKEDELMEYSELESDSEDKPIQKPRRPQDRTQGYPRSECFRVEKNLLVYGWGRWGDILSHGRFKRPLRERDVETICRALLAYCLLHYRGDENIKSFIWDLITPTEDGQSRTLTNHTGLSTPVPRGRKGKKGKPQAPQPHVPQADWLADCNPDILLQEDSYKRHLKHHCNKVLLRVRMLYYLRQEVIGDQADRILEGTDSSRLDIWLPQPFHAEVPTDWWDLEADKSLLIGVFKHGYEKYNSMRADPTLCFLERVGMPDAKAIAAEQRGADMMADGGEGEDEDPEYKPLRMPFKDDLDDFTNSPLDDKDDGIDGESGEAPKAGENGKAGNLCWPPASALTARLRRLITAYQRTHKREQLRQEAVTKPDRRRRRPRDDILSMVTEGGPYAPDGAMAFLAEGGPFMSKGSPFIPDGAALLADGAAYFKERRQRWTRREEADFYRVVSTFGVVCDIHKQCFDWSQFRAIARLDKKTDESLEKYYFSFVAMCKRVCRMQLKTENELPDPTLIIDPITEERASRTLYRIELLRRIREQVLPHPLLEERLSLCQPSPDLPAWWEPGRHDRDLLQGAAKHGVSRTDYHILNDPELSFLEAHRKFTQGKGAELPITFDSLTHLALVKDDEVKEEQTDNVVPKAENSNNTVEVKEEKAEVMSPKEEVKKKEALAKHLGLKQEPKEKMDVEEKEGKMEVKTTKEEQGSPEAGLAEEVKPMDQEPTDTLPTLEAKNTQEEETNLFTGKSSEDEEDNMDEDDKSEKSSQAEAGAASERKNFDEESNASLSTARDETRDCFSIDDVEPSAPQMFSEHSLFSFWPKDRVMINRMDNICEAVTKGKWPSNRRQFFDFPGLLPGYGSMTTDSPLQRQSLGDISMVGQTSYSGSEDLTMSPQVNKQDDLSLSVPRQRRRRRRKVEIEAERAAKRRNLMEMVAQLRESHAAEGQAQAMDLTKALHGMSSSSAFPGSMVSSTALKAQMELLQAGSSSRPRANGSLLDAELPNRRKRGRRKNVEGLELLFMGKKRAQLNAEDSDGTKAFMDGAHMPGQAHRHISSPTQKAPGDGLEEGTHLKGEDGSSTKDLREWLRQHPTYTMDMPGYVPKNEDLLLSQFGKPKQKRHRCRNPNKIDINTLTGEERVPVVNIRNGRKMGGAMAPPMKDLPRWLVENPEFAIAPDWTDIVKQSGFLPESMFDRLLTGPVVREEGVRRRGRRPKSEIAKATAAAQAAAAVASTSGVNPLLMNGLFGGMDLTSLQGLQNLQSLQLAAGLMGFPPALGGGADAKHAAAMLPLMLPGMGGLPNMFSLGGLFGGNLAADATATNGASGTEQADPEEKTKPKKDVETKEEGEEKDKESEKPAETKSTEATGDTAALAAAVAAATAGMSTNALAFNPFLLSTMAPGLFYPSMFLPPSLGGLGLPGFPQASLADLQSTVSGALGATGEDKESSKGPNTDQDQNAFTADVETADNTLEDSDSEESQNKTADSSVLDDDLAGPADEMDSIEGGMDEDDDNDDDDDDMDDPADEEDKSD
ncbi:chromodomain-helicase-DNA-binding protein 7-like isoform X1 [Xyrauchen texanus]|uniref:chromodomain-helicase-DNA-binding protein 7-like isoform X1 n=1 Tax=Xyrauchen texanus TaxID=154827 RepID=UPI00224274E5|nr:chromodomain-helicase-DNA-binding protein 7-like isoform X1 [Xyrauchen texanus]